MKNFFILLSAWLWPILAFSQKILPDFGKIDPKDLELRSCSFEPGAPAMKLFDIQDAEVQLFHYGTRIETERRVRIKIFNTDGYKHATIKIPYNSKRAVSKIKNLSGIVYNLEPDGRIVTEVLDETDIFKNKVYKNSNTVTFTFPNVKQGSVIEFKYTKIEKNMSQLDPWLIQGEIPVVYTANTITTPAISTLREITYGLDSIIRKDDMLGSGSNKRRRSSYYKEEINSFSPEPFMSSYKDNLQKIIYLLTPDDGLLLKVFSDPETVWKFGGRSLLNSQFFGKQIKKTIPGTEGIIDSARAISTVEKRIAYLCQAIRRRIPESTEQRFYVDDIAEAWKNKSANSAEINMIMLNLLGKTKISAHPLLISTRENGRINQDFPSFGQLNGVDILAVDSNKFYVLDASLKFQSPLLPPMNILNRNALLLDSSDIHWIMITDDRPLMKSNINIIAEILQNGNLEGTAMAQYFDFAKSYHLDTTQQDENEQDKKYFDKKSPGLKIISVKQENAEELLEPLFETTEFTFELPSTDSFFFINPHFLFDKKVNPFISENRKTDIDLGCNQEMSISMQLIVPESFDVDFLPKNILVRAPDSSFTFRRIYSKNGETLSMQQVVSIKRHLFGKEDYPGLQEFFKRMYALMTEEIVMRKKR